MSPKTEKKNETSQSGDEEEEVQSLHEMITEALMGNIPVDSSSYTNVNFNTNNLPEHEAQLLYAANETHEEAQFTLGTLYQKFQDLDSRLTRVEMVIKREDFGGYAVKKRAPTLSRSTYPGSTDPCFGGSSNSGLGSPSSTGLTTINPILTSSNEILSMNSYQGSSSSFSLSAISHPKKIQSKNEIKRSELDHICLPLLECNPKPTTEELQDIANDLAPIYPDIPVKQLLSKVREWFRKRREYMSQRIFLACSTYFQDIQIETEAELESEITKFNQNPNVLDFILKNADLEITNSIVAREYCREKILSYLNGQYKPSSLKPNAYK